jgi:hypothetical protein
VLCCPIDVYEMTKRRVSNAEFYTPVLRNSSVHWTGSDRVHVEGPFWLPSSDLRIGPI